MAKIKICGFTERQDIDEALAAGIEIIGIILMPLGWFGIWEGLSKIVDSSPAFAREDQLFEKFAKASYRFKYIQE